MNNDTMGPFVTLTDEELDEVRSATKEAQQHLFIAGYVDFIAQEVVLFKVDESELDVPLSLFTARAGIVPEFDKLEIIDHGNTIKFGSYEASSSSILYDLDKDYKEYCDTNRMIN